MATLYLSALLWTIKKSRFFSRETKKCFFKTIKKNISKVNTQVAYTCMSWTKLKYFALAGSLSKCHECVCVWMLWMSEHMCSGVTGEWICVWVVNWDLDLAELCSMREPLVCVCYSTEFNPSQLLSTTQERHDSN